MTLDNCNALITGASAGIGREFARQLAGRARSMILVARREDRLAELRDELQQQHPNLVVQIRQVDLADFAQLHELMEWLDRERIDVDVLVNNAGLGDSGPFATSGLTYSPHPSANDRETPRRHSKRQFVGWLYSDAWFRRLRSDQGLCHQFLGSTSSRTPRNRRKRMRVVSWPCSNGISTSRQAHGWSAANRPGIPCSSTQTSRARRDKWA